MTALPAGFGNGEFTLELWVRPDNAYPVGPVRPEGSADQLINWSEADPQPYSTDSWWWQGNFLLDGHNNNYWQDGTFSLQVYGGGRVRWDFGDGAIAGPGSHWSVETWPASTTTSLLDGNWHQVACVRRWVDVSSASLELWIDGFIVAEEISDRRTDMATAFWNEWTGFPSGQEGWFWGSEKQAAVGVLSQYEDYKGLLDDVRFWSRAKSLNELSNDWALPVTGNEPGLVGWYTFSEAAGTSACSTLVATECMSLVNTTSANWSASDAPTLGDPDPNYIYVDFGAGIGGNGFRDAPYNSLSAGVNAANSGATIEIAPGVSSETLTVTKPLRLINGNPTNGSVRIGG